MNKGEAIMLETLDTYICLPIVKYPRKAYVPVSIVRSYCKNLIGWVDFIRHQDTTIMAWDHGRGSDAKLDRFSLYLVHILTVWVGHIIKYIVCDRVPK